jgi:hypothetical protein
MKRDEKVREIESYLNNVETQKILSVADVTEKKITAILKRIQKPDIKASYVGDILTALKNIKNAVIAYDSVMHMDMTTPELWDYYILMDFDNLEMRKRKAAIKGLKEAWKTLPKYVKVKHDKTK